MIVRSALLRRAYFVVGGVPALLLCLYVPLAVWTGITVFLNDPNHSVDNLFFLVLLPLFGLGATVSGLLVLLNVQASSLKARVAHSVTLSLGAGTGFLFGWPVRDWGELFFLLPAFVGGMLVFHIWRSARQRASADVHRSTIKPS